MADRVLANENIGLRRSEAMTTLMIFTGSDSSKEIDGALSQPRKINNFYGKREKRSAMITRCGKAL